MTTTEAEGSSRLERQLRWLLLAYPPGPRREELLDTIIDGEQDGGRLRPSARQALNLLRHGMRARLGHPRSRAVVVLATLVTLLAGVLGAAAAAPLGWAMTPSLPEGAASDELKREVLPGLTVWGGGDAARWVRTGDGEGWQYGFAEYWAQHTNEPRDVSAYTEQVRDRLAAQGWRIRGDVELARPLPDEEPPTTTSASFWATRDGLVLHFDDSAALRDSGRYAGFTVSRSAPATVWVIALIGGLAGALIGWLVTGWVARRVQERRLLRAVTILSTVAGLVILLPLVAFVMLYSIPDDAPRLVDEKFFLGLRGVLIGLWQPALLFACVMLLLASTPRRSEWSRPARIVAFGAAVLALVSVGFAGRAQRFVESARSAAAADRTCVLAAPVWDATNGGPLSYQARIFILPRTTAEQRNLVDAAIARNPGMRGFNFSFDPTSAAYRDAYCDGAPLPPEAGKDLPYFWDVDLSSPGVLPGLAAEVGSLPGVVAVKSA